MAGDWLLDLGHSRLKLARRSGEGLPTGHQAMPAEAFPRWLDDQAPPAGDRFWLAATPAAEQWRPLVEALERRGCRWRQVVTGAVPLPVAAAYPELGVDRWLSMQPVWLKYGGPFCLVGFGTASTVDLVDGQGVHRGGWIAPGLGPARDALFGRAPGLRRAGSVADLDPGPACDTARAVARGLWMQQLGLVRMALDEAGKRPGFDGIRLVLTGGDASALQSANIAWPVEVIVAPDLVLEGLALAVDRLLHS